MSYDCVRVSSSVPSPQLIISYLFTFLRTCWLFANVKAGRTVSVKAHCCGVCIWGSPLLAARMAYFQYCTMAGSKVKGE